MQKDTDIIHRDIKMQLSPMEAVVLSMVLSETEKLWPGDMCECIKNLPKWSILTLYQPSLF
jgi:hypothetical protein